MSELNTEKHIYLFDEEPTDSVIKSLNPPVVAYSRDTDNVIYRKVEPKNSWYIYGNTTQEAKDYVEIETDVSVGNSYAEYINGSSDSIEILNFGEKVEFDVPLTSCSGMFSDCSSLTSLDLSGWDMSNVRQLLDMLRYCNSLTTIYARGCNETTITKLNSVKPSGCTIVTE